MPDSNIGALPQVANLDDSSLMVVEQQGQAMKMTGAQFKDFGKQSVIGEVQGYVTEAQKAAQSATGAVEAVVNMTVEASALEEGQGATVEKSTQDGVVHLAFGLPRGPQGVPGPEGKLGPRGPKGEPGTGLTILGYYDTPEALFAAQPSPAPGEAYGVGTEAPYDIYVFDGESGGWKNNGPLSGGGGGTILPENVVTTEGGAELEVTGGLGEAPWLITLTDEEETDRTPNADDIAYGEGSVAQALDGLFISVSDGKAAVASAITDKGVPTEPDAAFAQMAENIGKISGGADTSDATATPGDILAGKTAYTAAGKVEGIIPTLGARTITPGTAEQIIDRGQYVGGIQRISGDTNLVSGNIKKGVSIFGVAGAVEQSFAATLTVTVDVGAVVTATLGDTEVSALCTTGQATLELPAEGKWTVTAVRGVAQYNSVVIEVSSRYAAALSAEVHIEYFGPVTPLPRPRSNAAAASTGAHSLIAGGVDARTPVVGGHPYDYLSTVDAYDANLVQSTPPAMSLGRSYLAGASVGGQFVFAGGIKDNGASTNSSIIVNTVTAYNASLTRAEVSSLSGPRYRLAGAAIGTYALFGGGKAGEWDNSTNSSMVEAYSESLERSTATSLATAGPMAAAANASYAMFCNTSGTAQISAYNAGLSRSIPTAPQNLPVAAARAGNYVVFAADGTEKLDAYDLFLTKAMPDGLGEESQVLAAVDLKDCALVVTKTESVVYDPFLTRTIQRGLAEARTGMTAASIGEYALFAGGTVYTTGLWYKNTVEAYRYV